MSPESTQLLQEAREAFDRSDWEEARALYQRALDEETPMQQLGVIPVPEEAAPGA